MPRCNTETTATMSELICNGCRSLVTYNRSATNIRCSRCSCLNSTRAASQMAHLTCGRCRTTLMYPPGASTVECGSCRHVNHARGQGSSAPPDAWPQTVLVENPRTMNDKGKLVSNVAVGVTSWKR
ncbi:protein LOL4-like [Lolium rigidum]|uniref:protein LOL4-like n=1 Tax=Lolium rigidum TaxID=89674 RepID=UPI001F5D5560|nr:protein LOL4-like [Lolium rigidum]